MGLFGNKKKAEEEDALAAISKQLEKFSSENREQLKKLEERVKKLHETSEKLATKSEVSKMGEGFAKAEDVAKARDGLAKLDAKVSDVRKGLATTEDVAKAREGFASVQYVNNVKDALLTEIKDRFVNLDCKSGGCDLGEDLRSAKATIADLKRAYDEAAGKLKELDVEALKKRVYDDALSYITKKLDEYRANYEKSLSEHLKNAPGNLAAILVQEVRKQTADFVEQLKKELQITGDDIEAKCNGVAEQLELAHHKIYFHSLSPHHQSLLLRLVSNYTNAQGAENALSNPKNRYFEAGDWDQLLRMMDSARRNQNISVKYLYPAVQEIREAKSNLKPS